MKFSKINRMLALLLSASMLTAQAPVSALAEGTTEVQTEVQTSAPETEAPVQTETSAPETEAPVQTETSAPETEAPVQTETSAPETEAPAQTETSAVEIETTAPETEAPAQTETSAPEPETSGDIPSKKKDKKKKETEVEETDTFTISSGTRKVTITLSGGQKLPADTKVSLEEFTETSDPAVWKDAKSKLADWLGRGHRVVAGMHLYQAAFTDKKGREVSVRDSFTVTIEDSKAVDLELDEYLEPAAALFEIGDREADWIDDIELNRKQQVEALEFETKAGELIVLAGIQNRENDGDKVKKAALKKKLKAFAGKTERTGEHKDEDDADARKAAEKRQEDAAEYGRVLANAANGKEVAVVNLYADRDGRIGTDPLKAVLDKDEKAIDVTSRSVVINIIAYEQDQELTLPVYPVKGKGTAQENAEKVIYNIVAEEKDDKAGEDNKTVSFADYLGKLTVDSAVSGSILAARASVDVSAQLTGSVIAEDVTGDIEEPETESISEEMTEEVTEPQTEDIREEETEPQTEDIEELTEEEAAAEDKAADEGTKIVTDLPLAVSGLGADADRTAVHYELVYTGVSGVNETILAAVTAGDTAVHLDSTADYSSAENGEQIRAAYDTYLSKGLAEANPALSTLILRQVTETVPAGYVLENREQAEQKVVLQQNQETGEITAVQEDGSAFAGFVYQYIYPELLLQVSVLDKDAATEPDGSQESIADTVITVTAADKDGNVVEIDKVTIDAGSKTAGAQIPLDAAKLREKLGYAAEDDWEGAELTVTQTPAAGYLPVEKENDGNKVQTLKVTLSSEGEESPKLAVQSGEGTAVPDTNIYQISMLDETFDTAVPSVTVSSVAKDSGKQISGMTYKLYKAAGGKAGGGAVIPPTIGANVSVKPDYKFTQEELKALAGGETITWSVEMASNTNTSYPMLSGESVRDVVISLDMAAKKLTAAALTFEYNKYVPTLTNEDLTVTKNILHNGAGIQLGTKQTYYAALYNEKDVLVRGPQAINIDANGRSGSTTFTGLIPGTYYLREVTTADPETTKPVPASREAAAAITGAAYWASYEDGDENGKKIVVTGMSPGGSAQRAVINNNYMSVPSTTKYYGAVRIYKEYYDEKGEPKKVTGRFYYKIKNVSTGKYMKTADGKEVFSIVLNNASRGRSSRQLYSFKTANGTRKLQIEETDKDGKPLESGDTYTITYTNQNLTVKPSSSEITATIKNQEVGKKNDEDEEGPAVLKLTKKVTYKGSPIRVNAVYYIGIFDDAALTKLRYKKAMRFENASEVSSDLTIHIEKLKSKQVTFYFAEVDSNGKVVSSGEKVGYNITQNKKSITLSMDNRKDEVVITNDILAGSKTAQALTKPGSTFAGDPAALAQAQAIEADKNAGTKTTTGDSSPIVPLAIALVLSAALICALFIILRRRRR